MPMVTDEAIQTLEEMIDSDRDKRYELVDGRLMEKHDMGAYANRFGGILFLFIGNFIFQNKLGHFFPDTEFTCFPGRIRRPDFSFIRGSRLSGKDVPRGRLSLPPDLAIEVVSPNDSFYEVNQRIADYLQAGVKEVWIVDPELRTISIRKSGVPTIELDENSTLKSDDLLPGFALKVSEIFQ